MESKPRPEDVWLDDKNEVLDYDTGILEPFYKDDRLAELGWALEQVLLDGVNDPIEHTVFDNLASNSCTTAYGLSIIRFPGGMPRKRIRHPAEARGSSSEFGIQYRIQCPVAMDYIHRFFTKKFWETTVPKYGLKAYHPQRWHDAKLNFNLGPGEQLKVKLPVAQEPKPPLGRMTSPPPSIDDFDPTIDTTTNVGNNANESPGTVPSGPSATNPS